MNGYDPQLFAVGSKMKIVDKFKELPPGAQIGIMLIGGGVLLAGGIALAMSGNKATSAAKPLPGPGPVPLPPSTIPQKAPYHITYRGVTATIGQDPDDPEKWIAVYAINGQKAGIYTRTNESGIIKRFNDAVDAYYANAKWFALNLSNGITLKSNVVYRLSLPTNVQVALPVVSMGRTISFSELPEDWPPDDRTDPTRFRYELWPTSDLPLPPLSKAFGWALSTTTAPQPRA